MSRLAHAEVDGERLSDEEIFSFLRLLLPAGAETTFRLIGNLLYALLDNPSALDAVRADRAAGRLGDRGNAALGIAGAVRLARDHARRPALRASSCPPARSSCWRWAPPTATSAASPIPARFDLQRRPEEHFAFGFGRHFCAGAHLARLEARVALNALLDRLPNLRFAPDAERRIVGLAFRSPTALPRATFAS